MVWCLIYAFACLLTTSIADEQLFAILGPNSCGTALYYGPQLLTTSGTADGIHFQYISTNTASKEVPHDEWLQIVTSDGETEIFRIYWTFATKKTLAHRFVNAANTGEVVNYRVVDAATHQEYAYSGTWRFSSVALMSPSKFNVETSTCCFSTEDGAWGAGNGVIDANGDLFGYVAASFWGVGNWKSVHDGGCNFVYKNGVQLNSYGNYAVTYMYYDAEMPPSAEPTAAPTNPSDILTALPTPSPTTTPSIRPQPAGQQILFAVVGSQSCAENLYYGPQAITTLGSADGLHRFFLSTTTTSSNVAHTQWLQVVTRDGIKELFRIYWTFNTTRTLEGHFTTAVSQGVPVSFIVYDASSSLEYAYAGTWWFSNSAAITSSKFAVTTTHSGFSADDGIWGAFNGVGDPNNSPSGYSSTEFWGVGNWDSSDTNACKVYKNGNWFNYGTGVKSYMYYFALVPPTQMPTVAPSYPTPLPSAAATHPPTAEPSMRPAEPRTPVPSPATTPSYPTPRPSAAATHPPTAKHSVRPAEPPTPVPSPAATPRATFPPDAGTDQLFAVVGGQNCAEQLAYGPQLISMAGSGDGVYPYFLSTVTPARSVPHTKWLQVVTVDGSNELFRIYWTFDTPRTLAEHFIAATTQGVAVSYRVEMPGGYVYPFADTWWFSNGAQISAAQFNTSTTVVGFSADGGAWGAGSGVIQANGNSSAFGRVNFWGVGNLGGVDNAECDKIFVNGHAYIFDSAKTYMYYSITTYPTSAPTAAPSNLTSVPTPGDAPSGKPTQVPTADPTQRPACVPTPRPSAAATRLPTAKPSVRPTAPPTLAPSRAPTPRATLPSTASLDQLFAVLGGPRCAEQLAYGPQTITTAGSADGLHPYFLSTFTSARNIPHTKWTQIVTYDGTTELFRIYWTFNTPRTLADHFIAAVAHGVAVSYRVETPAGGVYTYEGTWWFSKGAQMSTAKFNTPITTVGFSADDGAWGAGSGVIQAHGNNGAYRQVKFWGVGNWGSVDNAECYKIFTDGVAYVFASGNGPTTYMYYSISTDPTAVPTAAPSNPTSVPFRGGAPSRVPTHASTMAPSVLPTASSPVVQMDVVQVSVGAPLYSLVRASSPWIAFILSRVIPRSE
jgi:hypothetical protein